MIIKENRNTINLIPKDLVLGNMEKYIQEVLNNPMLPLVSEGFVVLSKDFYDILIKNLNRTAQTPDIVSTIEIEKSNVSEEDYNWKEIRL